MSNTVSGRHSHQDPPAAEPDRERRGSAALSTSSSEEPRYLATSMPHTAHTARYQRDGRRILFWIIVGVGGTLLIVFMKQVLPWVRLGLSGLGLSSRILLSSTLGIVLFGLFFHKLVQGLSERVRYSPRVPSVDTGTISKVAAGALGVIAPVSVFFVLSAIRLHSIWATLALGVGYLLGVAATVRVSVLVDRYLRKYPEDQVLELLKRGEPYSRDRVLRLVHTLSVEWDSDIRRIRLRRLRRLIRYIEGHKLDPEALERQSLGETLMADLERRTQAAFLERFQAEAVFEKNRFRYKQERLRQRREGAGGARVEDLEDALKDAARGGLGERRPDGHEFHEVGDVTDE